MNVRFVALGATGLLLAGMWAFSRDDLIIERGTPLAGTPVQLIHRYFEGVQRPLPVVIIPDSMNWSHQEVLLPDFDAAYARSHQLMVQSSAERPPLQITSVHPHWGRTTLTLLQARRSDLAYPEVLSDQAANRILLSSMGEASGYEAPTVSILGPDRQVIAQDSHPRVEGFSPLPGNVAELPLYQGTNSGECANLSVVGYVQVKYACTSQNLRIASAGLYEWEQIAQEGAEEPEVALLP